MTIFAVNDFKEGHIWSIKVGTPGDKYDSWLGRKRARRVCFSTHGVQSCLPFINKHQCIPCRARVSYTVVDKDYRIWFW